MAIVKTLEEKTIDYRNYHGEGVNEKSQLQTYFQVANNLVAMVGYSRELFLGEELTEHRPFRTIITIYFIDNEELKRRLVMKSY